MPLEIDLYYIARVVQKLLAMVPITLFVVIISASLSFILGVVITAIRVKKIKVLYQIISVYVSFSRSTPVLIQLFVVYYGFPLLFKAIGVDINDWSGITFAAITLIFHTAAVLTEILRPAYLAVDKGQHDAADSIGLTEFQKIKRIICPQVFPVALPSIGNLFIDLIKDTSILFTIGVIDLMGRAKQIIANDYGVGKLQVLIAVALIYWGISALADKFIHILEKRSEKYKLAKGLKSIRKGEWEHV